MLSPRHFPPPWSIEEQEACFTVRDKNGQAFAYVYFEEEPGRRTAAKLPPRDEARRIAANFVKDYPRLTRRPVIANTLWTACLVQQLLQSGEFKEEPEDAAPAAKLLTRDEARHIAVNIAKLRRSPTSLSRMSRDGRVAALFGLFAQDDARMRIHVMYLVTYRTSYRLIDVAVFRSIFGNKALNAVPGFGATAHEERQAELTSDEGQAVETLTAL
jgi:hypothetical protein